MRPDDDFLLYWRPTRKGVGVNFIAQREIATAQFLQEHIPSVIIEFDRLVEQLIGAWTR